MEIQRGLDFARLDAVTANLYLVIRPADVFELSIRQPAREIPSPVQALGLRLSEGGHTIGRNEFLCCQRGPV